MRLFSQGARAGNNTTCASNTNIVGKSCQSISKIRFVPEWGRVSGFLRTAVRSEGETPEILKCDVHEFERVRARGLREGHCPVGETEPALRTVDERWTRDQESLREFTGKNVSQINKDYWMIFDGARHRSMPTTAGPLSNGRCGTGKRRQYAPISVSRSSSMPKWCAISWRTTLWTSSWTSESVRQRMRIGRR